MLQITKLTAFPKQTQTLVLQDGTSIDFEIEYKPLQLSWFITSLSYKDFTATNIRICTSPNLLRQFKNLIPFGLCVTCLQKSDPYLEDDFISNRVSMFVLTSEEVEAYEDYLNGL